MTPPKYHPDACRARVLSMRLCPGGRLFRLHPADLELERYLDERGGTAVVKMQFLLVRNGHRRETEQNRRAYQPVED